MNDTIWQGLYTDYTRAEFATGGFTTYHGAQVSLRGRRSTRYFKDVNYVVSYALARNEAINGDAVSRLGLQHAPTSYARCGRGARQPREPEARRWSPGQGTNHVPGFGV